MFPTKFLIVLTICLSLLSNFAFIASGDDDATTQFPTCLNCSKCEYPCQQQPSPPFIYSAPPPPSSLPSPPPPPSPSPISSGYSIYGAPPPPQQKDPTKCPPAAGVQCCTPPAAPNYAFSPPNPYTPVPYGAASMLLPVLLPLVMFFSSYILLF